MDKKQVISKLQEQRDAEIKAATEDIRQKYNPKIRSLSSKLARETHQTRHKDWEDAILPAISKLKKSLVKPAAHSYDPYEISAGYVKVQYAGYVWNLRVRTRLVQNIADLWMNLNPEGTNEYFPIITAQFVVVPKYKDGNQAVLEITQNLLDDITKKIQRGWRPKEFHGDFSGKLPPAKSWERRPDYLYKRA